ncbi:MAG: lysophospholipase [Chloroflexia bacterium]|nr:lysophospholipase [Chloroflexia bacterium]
MPYQELNWSSRDGLDFFARLWQPETEARAVVSLVHGMGEHSGRYAHLGRVLNEAGYGLLAFDLRGHGKSPGQRGHTPSYEVLMDDITVLREQAARRFPGRPNFLYGHSMGGGLVLNYALRRRPQLAGVIATGPALRPAFQPGAGVLLLARLMNHLWPSFSMNNQLDLECLSRDPDVIDAYRQDPLVHDRLSARLGHLVLTTGPWALQHAAEFPLPLLLMHGSEDGLASAEASREFAQQFEGDCTCKIWEGLYHEIHNEPEQDGVFTFLLEWLETHL